MDGGRGGGAGRLLGGLERRAKYKCLRCAKGDEGKEQRQGQDDDKHVGAMFPHGGLCCGVWSVWCARASIKDVPRRRVCLLVMRPSLPFAYSAFKTQTHASSTHISHRQAHW